MQTDTRFFPVLGSDREGKKKKYVRWDILDNEWAQSVHGQTLNRLAERGGLCWEEIYWNLHKLRWATQVNPEELAKMIEEVSC